MTDRPAFAVVGHPNKGKSSIVATLAQDDAVAIACESGTTRHAQPYAMTVDGQALYTLIDTPGFQRARRVMDWLSAQKPSVADRPATVAAFVRAHAHDSAMRDEVELLDPIVKGAGVLYVVDGSVPYSEEYEIEMDILRWTGRPSMALINPIGQADHLDAWRSALGQYFSVVRVFDAMTAPFDKRLELLRAFGQLDEAWRIPMQQAVDQLLQERTRQRALAAGGIAQMIAQMIRLEVKKRLPPDTDPSPYRETLEQRYRDKLRILEIDGRLAVEQVYQQDRLQRDEAPLANGEDDLFSKQAWLRFGLTKRELVTAGALGGAVGGGMLDAAVGGTSFMTGALLGAAAGAAMAWWSADRLAKFRVMSLPLGGVEACYGPSRNANFPFVILNRARWHHHLVVQRTHAQRTVMQVGTPEPLPQDHVKSLASLFHRLRKAGNDWDRISPACEELTQVIDTLLNEPTDRVLAADDLADAENRQQQGDRNKADD